jgi:alkylhydroperoxidase family enzyme
VNDADVWKRLPEVEDGGGGRLPNWAIALAGALPRTTAAMLELDHVHRARNPLDPKLRARARWVAAHSNRSPYGAAYALADLKRAGGTDGEVRTLTGDPTSWPEAERPVLAFARKLTLAAYQVTDDEVEALCKLLGDALLVALVQTLAYANFQDRLLLTLGIAVEEGGPLPPVAVRFRNPFVGGAAVPARRPPPERPANAVARVDDAEWTQFDFDYLQSKMGSQRERTPRIAVPPLDAVRAYIPPGQNLKIQWSLVCLGYQPELALAWTRGLRTFPEESNQDRVFEELLFWVVTRSLQCFY